MALASVARAAANTQLEGIANITEIHLDSENHLFQLSGHLLGARDEIRLTIHDYRLEVLDDCALVTISSVAASPQWVAGLMNRYVRGKAIRIPISNDSGTKKALQSALFRLLRFVRVSRRCGLHALRRMRVVTVVTFQRWCPPLGRA